MFRRKIARHEQQKQQPLHSGSNPGLHPASHPPLPHGGRRDPPPPGAAPRQLVAPGAARPPRRIVQAKVNPLVARKRQTGPPKQTAFRPRPNALILGHTKDVEDSLGRDLAKVKEFQAKREANGGWSEARVATEFPLVTTKRELQEIMRYHIMRFNRSKEDTPVDPTDQDQFPRPVTLHRRDPRTVPAHGHGAQDEDDQPPSIDAAEAERIAKEKADREAQRALDLAQIAPVLKPNEPKAAKQDKKGKGLSVYYPRHTEEAKKASGIRYEETLPWHLEDADGKNVWVGSYIAALSEVHVALVIHNSGFRMIPLERYYRFNHKHTFQQMSLEQAEKAMGKLAGDVPRWVMADKLKEEQEAAKRDTAYYLRGGARVKVESQISRALPKSERMDDNEIDMEGDEFQDDDENPGFEADDEDSREQKERVRRDHLKSNIGIFGDVKEEDVDKEEEKEKIEELRNKLYGKKMRKVLVKKDDAKEYETDDSDSDNPFYVPSDSDDSDEDQDKEKEKGKEGEDKKADDAKKAAEQKDKSAPSAASGKPTTTPAGKGKAPDATKKVKNLKRPASPNPSESSGNESSRVAKKIKKNLAGASSNASRSGTPLPGRRLGGDAASDGEATAGEGSDGGLKLKKKITLKTATGPKGTPVGSRAGSPAPPAPGGSQSVSPSKAPAAAAAGAPTTGPITADLVISIAKEFPEGVKASILMKRYSAYIGDKPGQITKDAWIKLIKSYMYYKPGPDKLLIMRPGKDKPAAA